MMNSSHLAASAAARVGSSTMQLSPQGGWSSQVMDSSLQGNLRTVAACVLSFVAAAVSSAGGVGGGSLYVPILNIVAGLGLKTSTAFSTFMVTGGTLSNVLYTLFLRGSGGGGSGGGRPSLIDYDVAVVSQPCLLLGVSAGVVCNVMFPEWLITALFSLFLALATFKTYGVGVRRWRAETEEMGRRAEGGGIEDGAEEALLLGRSRRGCQWVDLVVLVTVWLCFFVMHLFIGGEGAQVGRSTSSHVESHTGSSRWPKSLWPWLSPAWIGHHKRRTSQAVSVKTSKLDALPAYAFPVAALLTGAMSGLFGIGGGLLLNPVLLQIGVPPKTASATTMFMVLFCASMSMVQFIILGINGIASALLYAATCFVASIVGLVAIEGAIRRSGRSSLIVFMVAAVLALSAVVIACSGAVRVWAQYASGHYMGFDLPCSARQQNLTTFV
ncbi:hypothetical protein ACP70R_018663 [Stipagrostis hirtigluma subsp. patula]